MQVSQFKSLELGRCKVGAQVKFTTKNTCYTLTVLNPNTVDVSIVGGKYWPDHSVVRMATDNLRINESVTILDAASQKVVTTSPVKVIQLWHE